MTTGIVNPRSFARLASARTSTGTSPRGAAAADHAPSATVVASNAPLPRISGPIGLAGTLTDSSAPTVTNETTIAKNRTVNETSFRGFGTATLATTDRPSPAIATTQGHRRWRARLREAGGRCYTRGCSRINVPETLRQAGRQGLGLFKPCAPSRAT